MYIKYFKRLNDIILSITFLIFLSPIVLLLSLLIFLNQKGNPFFVQKRPGKDEKIFNLIKFKTMNDDKDLNGILLPDNDRITNLGNFIRRTSLDEIPQLINVLKGDMSLIGPRPLLPQYLELYNEEQRKRHEVKPGITGWAQVNGRNLITWDEKFALDLYYIKNCSFKLDIVIIIKTIKRVVVGSDVNFDEKTTSDPFMGN